MPNYGLTDLYATWFNCQSATVIPDLDNFTSVTRLSNALRNCYALITMPKLPTSSTALTEVASMLDGNFGYTTGTVADLWNATNFPNITTYPNAFKGATGLTNYADIPDAWKGL